MQDRQQLLLVAGSVRDAFLIVTELERAGVEVDLERVETAAYMEAALEAKGWDFIIFDDRLPDFDWTTGLAICRQKGLDIPFIMLSGTMDDDPAVERIKAGVHEHVLRDSLARLPLAVRREVRSAQERRIRKHVEAARQLLRSKLGWLEVTVVGQTLDGTIVSWEADAERLYGYSASEMIGRPVSALLPSYHPEEAPQFLNEVAGTKRGECFETFCLRKDGSRLGLQFATCLIKDPTGRIIGTEIVAQDLLRTKQGQTVEMGSILDMLATMPPLDSVARLSRPDCKAAA